MARRGAVFGIAAAVFALDRWTKWLVETHMGPLDTKTVIPGLFNVVSSQNTGVAFGILSESTSRYRTLSLILVSLAAVAALGVMLWRAERLDGRSAASLALIFGGAAGNVFDRLRSGSVTDFLDFYLRGWHWYTFNLADSAICIGVGLIILGMIRPAELTKRSLAR